MDVKIDYIQQKILKQSDEKIYLIFQSLIQKYSIEHSENTNGIFLNLSLLTNEVIDDIYSTLQSSSSNAITYSPEQPIQIQSETTNPSRVQPMKKDTLKLTKFDTRLLELSKQRFPT